jgi:hypothetical protein
MEPPVQRFPPDRKAETDPRRGAERETKARSSGGGRAADAAATNFGQVFRSDLPFLPRKCHRALPGRTTAPFFSSTNA